MYLNLLRDLNNVKKYSWGSACLANLYRELCWASAKVGKVMGGYATLLQWSGGKLEYSATPHGDLVGYRSYIYHMESREFSWVPYRGFEEYLPRHAYRDMEIWSACTTIICFSIVKLQFGLQQDIPVDPMNLDRLHQIDMQDNHYSEWMKYHAK
ncbi:Serine/threonine-protein phosphatase 7 long form [Glycine max]|nr:Serine/threonine-protein phosphatase 7 long form [Glycine max]